ncbi:UNVERIFIED_CONTAM: hypothetical protein GTU68_057442 [Idotea baltica]|nr:hypothetical protein [Idotea baltica]
MEKLEAHQKGVLHRAFSVFVFNPAGELILQRRAAHKYHSPGLWTNTCCSHPRMGETAEEAAHRRLVEEMGFDCPLEYGFHFIYKKQVGELIEHELDHVFLGTFAGEPQLNLEETDAWRTMSLEDIQADMETHPNHYTEWFKICFAEVAQRHHQSVANHPRMS